MAILLIVDSSEIKKEQYELLRKEVDWERKAPEGMIFHAASFDGNGGLHVADVWASQEAVDKFFETRLVPAMRKLKIAPPTRKQAYTVHAAVAHEAIGQYRAKQLAR